MRGTEFSALASATSSVSRHIQFSDIAVPEPGAFGLLALGGVALFWKKLTRQGADTLKFKIENRE